MTSVVRPPTALGDGDGPPPPPPPLEEAQADVEMEPAPHDKLAQMKSELERLLQLQREWTETQQRKLQQKRELEQLLGSHALQVVASTPAEIKGNESEVQQPAVDAALAAENDEQKPMLARKEELRQLQEQAAAVAKKQQQTAAALAKKLEQLNATTVSALAATASDALPANAALPAKHKLDDVEAAAESAARATKKIVTLPAPADLHEFSIAPELLTASPDLERPALFRIATRFLLQTGQRISTPLLAEKFEAYTGKSAPQASAQNFHLPLSFPSPALQDRKSSSSPSAATTVKLDLKDRDGAAPSGHMRRWSPGGQSLDIVTFSASENGTVAIGKWLLMYHLTTFIDLEKQVVESVCTLVLQDLHGDLPHVQRIQEAVYLSTFYANLVGLSTTTSSESVASPSPSSIYNVLSDAIGCSSSSVTHSAQLSRLRYHRCRQFSGMLSGMEVWLMANKIKSNEEDEVMPGGLKMIQKHSQPANALSATTTFKKPFDLEQDSVFRQVRSYSAVTAEQKPRKRKKLDPMNMLCLYELSGVCNDENCPYQHQKDFEEATSSDGDDGHDDESKVDEARVDEAHQSPQFLSKEQLVLLQDLAHLRSKVMRKWPVIIGQGAALEETPSSKAAGEENNQKIPSIANELAPESSGTIDNDGDDGSSFLQLEDESEATNLDLTNASISGSGDSRYCEADESVGLSAKVLEEKIARNPADTDSWLLLAINQLDFEVKQSDDTTRISDSAWLLGQLTSIYRCLHLSAFPTSSSGLDESKLKLSLHILSRALEIEANAYCEALWLLYLHLSSLLSKRDFDSEFEMTEQAMHLIPSSHRLWVHYMAVGKLDSIQLSEALHSRVLSHVSKPGSFQGSHDDDKKPNLSGLLTALVIHLCIKLCGAGSSLRAVELLAALLQVPNTKMTTMNNSKQPESGSDLDWCGVVHHQLNWSDLATLSLVYAHLVLFNEIPAHIQKWLRVSGEDQQIQISAFELAVDTFASDQWTLEKLSPEDVKAAVDAYEITFHTVGKRDESDHSKASQFLDVVLHNSMILMVILDTQQEDQSQAAAFDGFLSNKRDVLLQFPSASFTAATLILARANDRDSSSSSLTAYELLTEMLHASSRTSFPEALHYYLCALRELSATPTLDEKTVPMLSLLTRLSESLDGVNHEEFAEFIAEIENATNHFGRTKMLKKLLYGLLSAWMDQLAAASREPEKHQLQSDQTVSDTSSSSSVAANIYVVLDICELMGLLLEPSAEIDGLELVLRSSKLKHLSAESRQLAWTMRFTLQVKVFIRDKLNSTSTSTRGEMLQLFQRYMESMNVVSESVLQAASRISKAVDHQGVQSAIFECLYPQHSPWLLLEDNVCIFELCAAALPEFELPSYYSSYNHWLSPSPRFCLKYAGIATHHWEWRKIRQGLRKCLLDSSTHDMALRALVALELKNQNMKGVARILEEAVAADPLSMEAWRLVLGMEILFGGRGSTGSSLSSLRATDLVAEITKRKLTVRANLYNDMELLNTSKSSLRGAKQMLSRSQETGDFHAWSIHRIPNAILMMDNLKSLDLRGNFLVEIPEAISRLIKLEVLNVSQNALVSVPASLAKLSELRVLNVSHNNLNTLPGTLWVHLLKLQELDLSANLITHLPAPPLSRLADLRVLQIGNNLLSNENVTQVRQLLAPKCAVGEVFLAKTSVEKETKSVVEDEPQGDQTTSSDAQAEVMDESTGRLTSGKEDVMIVDEERGKTDANAAEDGKNVLSLEDGEIGAFEYDDKGRSDAQQQSAESQDVQILSGSAATTVAEVEGQVNGHAEGQTSTAGTMNGDYELVTLSNDDEQHQPSPSSTEAATATTRMTNSELTPSELEICNAADLTDKFEAYINENHVSRAHVKQLNPALWRKYVESQLHLHAGLGRCVMCDLPNEGWNQRFNTMVLCPSCLRVAVEMLQVRAQISSIESELEESKEDH